MQWNGLIDVFAFTVLWSKSPVTLPLVFVAFFWLQVSSPNSLNCFILWSQVSSAQSWQRLFLLWWKTNLSLSHLWRSCWEHTMVNFEIKTGSLKPAWSRSCLRPNLDRKFCSIFCFSEHVGLLLQILLVNFLFLKISFPHIYWKIWFSFLESFKYLLVFSCNFD